MACSGCERRKAAIKAVSRKPSLAVWGLWRGVKRAVFGRDERDPEEAQDAPVRPDGDEVDTELRAGLGASRKRMV